MPYSKSRARLNFEELSTKLLRLSKEASYKKSGFGYEHQNLIFQSAIFSICAGVEEYNKNFFEDYIFECKKNMIPLAKLPINLRLMSLLREQKELYKQFIFNGDEAKTLERISRSKHIYDIMLDEGPIQENIRAGSILGTNKYPSIKNLKIIYNRIGISDIFTMLHKRSGSNIKDQLASFLSIRESISHQTPPPLTYIDIKRHLYNLRKLINQLDRINFTELSKVSGTDCWPSN